jgi:glycine cleavage system pyridoxal-binding protein P
MTHPYLPLTDPNRSQMLQQVGVNSVEGLLADIPSQVRLFIL